ncbi:MAG: sigma 54-interacting transcriptional regulator [Negativicutes bacterium]|nr:sigma 54-interacting transcriptional regulator [Negativicutes bacterium]
MAEIMLIAPQPEIVELAKDLGWGLPEMEICQARLDEGVTAAREAVAKGTKVLVSRGLTYQMIAAALPEVHSVEIKFSGYDILRAYLEASLVATPVAIVEQQEVIDGLASIEGILGLGNATIKIPFDHRWDYSDGVEKAIRQGAACIVGNQAIVQAANRRGLPGVLVHSGQEAVTVAMSVAQNILAQLRLKETNARQLDTIINAVDYGMLAVDKQGKITAINTEARRLFGLEGTGISQETAFVETMTQATDLKEKRTGLVEIIGENTEVVVNYHPIIVNDTVSGMVATLQELKQLQDMEQKTRRELARRGWVARHKFSDIQSKAPAMQRLIHDANRLAGFDATVLVLGETGVGKEYFAHAIHNASRRKNGPFVAVNCASIPENILESELFGYAEGAFTGAKRGGKMGLFEQAHGGTIFLDEIGEMVAQCQARLLRVLQEHEVYRLGDDRTIPVDIRVIAATNRDLWSTVQEKKFREDLYYRLEVLTIEVPPLRERKVDIEVFVGQFIQKFNRQYRTDVKAISLDGLALLQQYDWPGNIRELQNIVGRLVALAGAPEITAVDVSRCLKNRLSAPNTLEEGFQAAEAAVIRQALEKAGGNKQQAAELLGICRSTLWRKLKQAERN